MSAELVTRERALGMTPATAFGVGILFTVTAATVIWNMPDKAWDIGIRWLNALHQRD